MMSGRGTITSRAMVSPNSKIEWMSSFSSSSISPSSEATSAEARSSCSVMNGPSRSPLPGISALASRTRLFATGPSSVPMKEIGRATKSATPSVRWIANVFGVTSAKRNSSSVIATVATISPALSQCRTANDVATVEPPMVNSRVRNSTTFR